MLNTCEQLKLSPHVLRDAVISCPLSDSGSHPSYLTSINSREIHFAVSGMLRSQDVLRKRLIFHGLPRNQLLMLGNNRPTNFVQALQAIGKRSAHTDLSVAQYLS